ncbi:MAG: hypothetical protein ABL921_07225 [Pirellula sp.]
MYCRVDSDTAANRYSELDRQVVDLGQEFEAALRELLDHVKAVLDHRQQHIVGLLLENRLQSEIASSLGVSLSTIEKEIVLIKKEFLFTLGEDFEQRATSNEQRATSNEQRATSNEQRATSNEQRRRNPA